MKITADPERWLQSMQNVTRQIAEQEQTIQNLQAQVRDLEETNLLLTATNQGTVAELRQQLGQALDRASNAAPTVRLTEKLPDPEKFDGTRSKLRPFLANLRLKLHGNSDRYPSEQLKLFYAYSRLEGSATAQLLPYVQGTVINLADFEAFVKILETSFGDPDRQATAQRELAQLRQSNRDFHAYLADFQRIVADTGYTDEEAKIGALSQGISSELRNLMIHHDRPKTLAEYTTLLQNLDNRYRAAQAVAPKRPFGSSTFLANRTTSAPTTTTRPTSITAPSPAPAVFTRSSTVASPLLAGDPMDLSAARRRGPLSVAEKSRRIVQGLCIYCGGDGHFARDCPHKPQGGVYRRHQVNEATVSSAVVDTATEAGNA